MSALQAIRENLQGLDIPVEIAPYEGENDSYITYGLKDSRGACWGDDGAQENIEDVEICIHTPLYENTEDLTRKVRRLIGRDERFTYPRITYDYNPDTRQRFAILTCEYVE